MSNGVPRGGEGKYRKALARTDRPIFTTFSDRDVPLTEIYQYFVRRPRDAVESVRIDSDAPPAPPNEFAALGGFGPQPLPPAELAEGEITWAYLRAPGESYSLLPSARVVGLRNKGKQIDCHGCVSNPFTWWALCQLVQR